MSSFVYIFRLGGRKNSLPKKYNLIFRRHENWCKIKTPSDFTSDDLDHLFTPQEASRLLPDVKIKLKEIMERKKFADALKEDLERYSLVGFDTPELSQKNQELDMVVKDLMMKVSELEDLGLKVRDIDMGLVDFPGHEVWQHGLPLLEVRRVRHRVLAFR